MKASKVIIQYHLIFHRQIDKPEMQFPPIYHYHGNSKRFSGISDRAAER